MLDDSCERSENEMLILNCNLMQTENALVYYHFGYLSVKQSLCKCNMVVLDGVVVTHILMVFLGQVYGKGKSNPK